MLCEPFFNATDGGSLAAKERGHPMLPSILLHAARGIGTVVSSGHEGLGERGLTQELIANAGTAENAATQRGSSPESYSTEDTATGGSRASSVSWISNDGGALSPETFITPRRERGR